MMLVNTFKRFFSLVPGPPTAFFKSSYPFTAFFTGTFCSEITLLTIFLISVSVNLITLFFIKTNLLFVYKYQINYNSLEIYFLENQIFSSYPKSVIPPHHQTNECYLSQSFCFPFFRFQD